MPYFYPDNLPNMTRESALLPKSFVAITAFNRLCNFRAKIKSLQIRVNK